MNDKQRRFVQEYLKDLNAAQAAIRAGYSKKTARSIGQRLLTEVDVKEAVKRGIEKRAVRCEVTQDWVVQRLMAIAGTNMTELAEWNASGVSYKDSASLSETARASIHSVEETTNEHGGSLKIKQHDKLKALELLGKHLGMFQEKIQITGAQPTENPAIEVKSEVLKNLLEQLPEDEDDGEDES